MLPWWREWARNVSKNEIDDSKNIIWKCSRLCDHYEIIRNRFDWKMFTNYPGIKLEWAVWKWKIVGKCYVYLTAKQVISCRGYDEKGCEICKNEKCTCKACKTTDFCRRICKSVTFLSSILLKLPIILAWPNWASLVSRIFNCLHGLRYFVAAGDPSTRNNFLHENNLKVLSKNEKRELHLKM